MLMQALDAMQAVRHTANDPSSEPRRKKRGLRLSYLSWIAIAAAAVGGELAIQLAHHDRLERIQAPIANVSAFHVLSAADVRPLWRPVSQIPQNAISSANAVLGHVTLVSLAANQPITASELGPSAGARIGDLSVVGVPASAAMALDGDLTPGQNVEAIVHGLGRRPGYAKVLVLSVAKTGTGARPYVVLVAIPPHTARWVAAAMGAGTVTLVSEPAS